MTSLKMATVGPTYRSDNSGVINTTRVCCWNVDIWGASWETNRLTIVLFTSEYTEFTCNFFPQHYVTPTKEVQSGGEEDTNRTQQQSEPQQKPLLLPP